MTLDFDIIQLSHLDFNISSQGKQYSHINYHLTFIYIECENSHVHRTNINYNSTPNFY